jgi:acetyl-CoA C-acetyltransferase
MPSLLLGFYPAGKGGQAAETGKTAMDGSLPINPSGGLKSRGHPIGASGVAQVAEVVLRLRGAPETKGRREARRALTQSTGGLGANNLVTIIERSSRSTNIQNLWKPPVSSSVRRLPYKKKESHPTFTDDEGTIETFTILYVTPDGFLPPLALALIRKSKGGLLLAQGEDISHLKIGREVYLRKVGDSYLFTVKRQLYRVGEAFKKLLAGLPSIHYPRRKGQRPRGH